MKIIQHHKKPGLGYVYVFDLDGTLSDDRHRHWIALRAREAAERGMHVVSEEWWEKYNTGAIDDPPHAFVKSMYQSIAQGNGEIWIVTARPERFYKETLAWIEHHLLWKPDMVVMRKDGCMRFSGALKRDFLNSQIEVNCMGYIMAIDDNPGVCAELNKITDTFLFKVKDSKYPY